jgi:hypothetical protein
MNDRTDFSEPSAKNIALSVLGAILCEGRTMKSKKKKPWLNPPRIVDCFSGADATPSPLREEGRTGQSGVDIFGWGRTNPAPTVCKHGEGSCEECGTTNRRDMPHSTTGGLGSIGRLFRGRR